MFTDLGITGVSCPTRLSAKDKVRVEEANILRSLREEGLISKHKAEASGGVCFEIVEATGDERPRLPLRLEKLEKKSKKVLTEEEINAKLERAERRRKVRQRLSVFAEVIAHWRNQPLITTLQV